MHTRNDVASSTNSFGRSCQPAYIACTCNLRPADAQIARMFARARHPIQYTVNPFMDNPDETTAEERGHDVGQTLSTHEQRRSDLIRFVSGFTLHDDASDGNKSDASENSIRGEAFVEEIDNEMQDEDVWTDDDGDDNNSQMSENTDGEEGPPTYMQKLDTERRDQFWSRRGGR